MLSPSRLYWVEHLKGGGVMNLTNIQYTKIRKQINNEYLDAKVECLQQSPMVDNDSSNFFEPMADYLALLIIKK